MTYGIPTYTSGDGRRLALPDPAAWGAPPRTDLASGTTGNLGGQLGQPQDTSTLIGRNADGSPIVPNQNPYGWTYGAPGLAQGAGQAAVPQGGPDWARFTGGNTGASYNIQGFDPWHNLAQYNGGVYQTGAGLGGHANTPSGESDVNRVFRWTNDILNAQGIGQGDPRAAQIFAANVERLRSEYQAAGLDWNGSQFAHFGNPGAQSGAHDTAWRQAISNAAGTPPPASASPPMTAQTTSNPSSTPGAASVADTTTGANPGAGGGNPNPAATQTTNPSGGYAGQAPGLIMANPDLAYNAVLRRLGIDPNVHGMFTDYLRQHLGGAIQTLLQAAQGAGGSFDFNSALDNIAGQAFNGSNWMGYAGNAANQALAGLGSGQYANADFSKASPYIQNLLALKAEGMNPVAGSALLNSYGNMLNDYSGQIMANGGADKTGFMPYFQGSNFYRQLVPQTQP